MMPTKVVARCVLGLSLLFLIGCASSQDVTRFQDSAPRLVCVAEHTAVRSGVRDAIVEAVRLHGAEVRVIPATYVERHGMWEHSVDPAATLGCDAILFYVANWAWDITTYMHFANIWVTNPDVTQRLAQATYQAGAGPSKWINAREKILELIDQMFVAVGHSSVQHSGKTSAADTQLPQDQSDSLYTERLRTLKTIFDEGLIS